MLGNAGGAKGPDFWHASEDGEVKVIGAEPANTNYDPGPSVEARTTRRRCVTCRGVIAGPQHRAAKPMPKPRSEITVLMPISSALTLTNAPPGVAGVDWCVDLQVILELPVADLTPHHRAYDTHRCGALEAERVTDCGDDVTHAHRVRIAQRERRKVRLVDLDNG